MNDASLRQGRFGLAAPSMQMGQGFIGCQPGAPFREINRRQQIDIGKGERVARKESAVCQSLVNDFQAGDQASAPALDQLGQLSDIDRPR